MREIWIQSIKNSGSSLNVKGTIPKLQSTSELTQRGIVDELTLGRYILLSIEEFDKIKKELE